ncbi:probable Mitochondrial intermembrane space cysteine motif-containing protein MIC17 [Saccharomycodes ludwigii]|uniref:Probable Mitochondrial intermembrane space cysteine motif-containing protein MIC17 n=1 Tax=Saccharomycodes ludwigii TaxID=36035 RepID=A0A376B7T9_9ASCO|nr:hypothetical protein SCDLUD_000929 [Saccharomycodes ludwigii]KAH3903304.1 hypothetical protein SCDLUD_000929 [Saccharomycodes ludwigii]SSD60574.1 probable Mitochondrial intermembrane space cysteine motif-containing protein MIC17 [Saccharomycodes ludwigii]
MARSRGRSSRPVVQSRSAHTMAAPTHSASTPVSTPAPTSTQYSQPAAVSQPKQPGMFAQMASTAAGVAVGSAVGHTIGAGLTGLFSGSGSSDAAAAAQQEQVAAAPAQQQQLDQQVARSCDVDARNFTRCLEDNQGNMQICDYYLQQLKACQEAARQY